MIKQIKAESLVSVLLAMSIFSVLLLAYSKWQSYQNRSTHFIYQQQQALQIAENQIALRMAGLNCESHIQQNGITFAIQCGQGIIVKFPLGKIEIM